MSPQTPTVLTLIKASRDRLAGCSLFLFFDKLRVTKDTVKVILSISLSNYCDGRKQTIYSIICNLRVRICFYKLCSEDFDMPRFFAAAFIRILAFSLLTFLSLHANAQAPVLDVTYAPDPASSTIGGARAARPRLLNGRGRSNPLVPGFVGPPVAAPADLGSQSYNYVIPVLRLPGRAGLDLNLNLYYNSRVWDVDTVNGTVTFNADRDFPSYGFRLDYGFLEYDPANDQYIYTESDGGKHGLPNSGNYDSTDGTYMRYTVAQKVLAYRDGKKVSFEVFPSQSAATPPT